MRSVPGYPNSRFSVSYEGSNRRSVIKLHVEIPGMKYPSWRDYILCSYDGDSISFHLGDATDPEWVHERCGSSARRLCYLALLFGGSGCHGQVLSEREEASSDLIWQDLLDELFGVYESGTVLTS